MRRVRSDDSAAARKTGDERARSVSAAVWYERANALCLIYSRDALIFAHALSHAGAICEQSARTRARYIQRFPSCGGPPPPAMPFTFSLFVAAAFAIL